MAEETVETMMMDLTTERTATIRIDGKRYPATTIGLICSPVTRGPFLKVCRAALQLENFNFIEDALRTVFLDPLKLTVVDFQYFRTIYLELDSPQQINVPASLMDAHFEPLKRMHFGPTAAYRFRELLVHCLKEISHLMDNQAVKAFYNSAEFRALSSKADSGFLGRFRRRR